MEEFRFTLFNILTLLIMVLTLAMVAARSRARTKTPWPLAYYAAVLGFAIGFRYSLNVWLVLAGAVSSAIERWVPRARQAARLAELGALAYVFARALALLLMW